MIIVRTMQDVDNIPVKSVVPYVRSLITNILNRVDRGTLCPSTSHCTVHTGLVYGAT